MRYLYWIAFALATLAAVPYDDGGMEIDPNG